MRLLLGEHPQDEASFAVRLEGGRDDGVLSRRQLEAFTHLPQVDKVLTASRRRPPQQDIRAQVDLTASFILTTEEEVSVWLRQHEHCNCNSTAPQLNSTSVKVIKY